MMKMKTKNKIHQLENCSPRQGIRPYAKGASYSQFKMKFCWSSTGSGTVDWRKQSRAAESVPIWYLMCSTKWWGASNQQCRILESSNESQEEAAQVVVAKLENSVEAAASVRNSSNFIIIVSLSLISPFYFPSHYKKNIFVHISV